MAGRSACIHYQRRVPGERERDGDGRVGKRVRDAWISNKRVFALLHFRYAVRVCLSDGAASIFCVFALALRVQEVLIKREINRIRFH